MVGGCGRFENRDERKNACIARSLLDVIADDRLLAEKTGLSEAEAWGFRRRMVRHENR